MSDKKITYKEALEELEEIVNGIESEEVDVDELTKKVERASKLLTVCSEKLKNTEEEVDKIIEKLNDSEK
ncbi:MAG: exodeoxyribonuclease VII small subunit [Flavobacteriales bacterium]|nr:exodeoxyribonuclease VII small subunit [Flavobacteriales bacterium]